MASYEKEYVMFLVGRMNPPTPGHIRGLCVPFLRALREKCIEIIGEDVDGMSLVELAKRASVAPRLFLTNSTNEKRISYLSGSKAALYDKVKQIVKDKTSAAQMKDGIFYVKDKQLENPLDPELKKLYVIEMLGNELALPENSDIMVSKAILNMWIVCQTMGIESWCAAYGPASAIKCALMLNKPKKYDNVFFFMGVDEDPAEMARRSKFCQDSDTENEEGAKVKCVKLDRINTVDQDAAAADATEAIADGSMSASKIRLLCASGDTATLHRVYDGLLESQNINALINDVRDGLRLPPISDIDAIPPPLPPRRSPRGTSMAGPRIVDTTKRAYESGWTGVQKTPGANAIGMSGIQRVRDAETAAKNRDVKVMETIQEEKEKEGGRSKTRRIRRRNTMKTRRRKPRTNTARRNARIKPKKKGSRKTRRHRSRR